MPSHKHSPEDYGGEDEDNLFSIGSLAITKLENLRHPDDDYSFEAYVNFPMENEKQISVDPASLSQLTKVIGHPLTPRMPPKFISASLPCSTSTSPRFSWAPSGGMLKWREPPHMFHLALHPLARQRSTALPRSALQQGTYMRKSKSCGEGRSCAPSEEFDILSRRLSAIHQPESGVQVLYECSRDDLSDSNKDEEEDPHDGKSFKCGALCLFLPGLSKKKQTPATKEAKEDQGTAVSRAASLEKFECGSWANSAILDDEHEASIRSYFDLPLELIRSSANDANSPVKAAFIFDKNRKGVLKKSSSKSTPRKPHESSNRHVRFSTSGPSSHPPSPTSACITPRLLKARDEFNAFLQAQSA